MWITGAGLVFSCEVVRGTPVWGSTNRPTSLYSYNVEYHVLLYIYIKKELGLYEEYDFGIMLDLEALKASWLLFFYI